MSRKNPAINEHIASAQKWQPEMKALRSIILDTGLTEELKWDQPCYTHDGHNIVLIGGFKDHCRLMFCNGSLLSDPRSLLQKPGEHTQAGRFIPFTSVAEIKALEPELKSFLLAAIENEKAGVKPVYKNTPEPIPEELQQKLNRNPALDEAFAPSPPAASAPTCCTSTPPSSRPPAPPASKPARPASSPAKASTTASAATPKRCPPATARTSTSPRLPFPGSPYPGPRPR